MANGTFGGGSGTYLSPYIVEDAADLAAIANGPSLHYVQGKDIDASSLTDFNGIGTSTIPFTGTFDGRNYTISNLTISTTYSYVGIFSYVESPAVIRNINGSNFNISGSNYVGGIIGRINSSMSGGLQNCNLTNSVVSGTDYVGGIVGYYSGSIRSSRFEGTVSADDDYVGGITGYGYTLGCRAKANVSGDQWVGGLVGQGSYQSSIEDSVFEGGIITGSRNVGGISGGANNSTQYARRCLVIQADVISTYSGTSDTYSGAAGIACGNTTCYDCEFRSGLIQATNCRAFGVCSSSAYTSSCKGEVMGYNAYGITMGSAKDCYKSGPNVIGLGTGTAYAAGVAGQALNTERCYCSSNVEGNGNYVAGISSDSNEWTGNNGVKNCYFLGSYVKGSLSGTGFIGRISSRSHGGNANNYSLDTARIILE